MFPKYFAASFGSRLHHVVVAAAALYSPFPRIVSVKLSLLSTSPAGNDRPTGYPESENTCPMLKFFLNDCGMSQSQISDVFKIVPPFVRRRSAHVPQQAVQFMRDLGFTEYQVRKLIIKNPSFLTVKVDRRLKPKIEFMKTLGRTGQGLGRVIYNAPRLLNCSLEKTLCPNIQYLQNLFGSEAIISKAFKWAPTIFTKNNGPDILEKRLKQLESFGLLEDEIKELVRRSPLILAVSMDKVQKIMDFLIHTAGLPAKFLLKYPLALTFSLECRIKPRHEVLKAISAMQPSKRLPSLTCALYLSEQKFLEKYVECNLHSRKLLEIYHGNPVDLDIIQ